MENNMESTGNVGVVYGSYFSLSLLPKRQIGQNFLDESVPVPTIHIQNLRKSVFSTFMNILITLYAASASMHFFVFLFHAIFH